MGLQIVVVAQDKSNPWIFSNFLHGFDSTLNLSTDVCLRPFDAIGNGLLGPLGSGGLCAGELPTFSTFTTNTF